MEFLETNYLYIVIGFNGLILIEYIISLFLGKRLFKLNDTWANFTMYWGFILIHILYFGAFYGLYLLLYDVRLFADLPSLAAGYWILLVLLEDNCFYWFHRFSHRIRFLWASHVNHHSSSYFNLSTAVRQNWTPFFGGFFWLPLPFIGFKPEDVILVQSLSLLYQSLQHTQIVPRIVFLDPWLNTPSNHRVHHGAEDPYIDKNFGGVLMVWDRLYGTYQPEQKPVIYGIHPELKATNPWTIAFHEWKDIFKDSFRAKNPLLMMKSFIAPLSSDEKRSAGSSALATNNPESWFNSFGSLFIWSAILYWLVATSVSWQPALPESRSALLFFAYLIAGTLPLVLYSGSPRGGKKFLSGLLLAVYTVGLVVAPFIWFQVTSEVSALVTAGIIVLTFLKITGASVTLTRPITWPEALTFLTIWPYFTLPQNRERHVRNPLFAFAKILGGLTALAGGLYVLFVVLVDLPREWYLDSLAALPPLELSLIKGICVVLLFCGFAHYLFGLFALGGIAHHRRLRFDRLLRYDRLWYWFYPPYYKLGRSLLGMRRGVLYTGILVLFSFGLAGLCFEFISLVHSGLGNGFRYNGGFLGFFLLNGIYMLPAYYLSRNSERGNMPVKFLMRLVVLGGGLLLLAKTLPLFFYGWDRFFYPDWFTGRDFAGFVTYWMENLW